MDARRLYDRHAQPHLPSGQPYAGHLRSAFCDNAERMLVWIVDAQSGLLRQVGGNVPFPADAIAAYVLEMAPHFSGGTLTAIVPYDRLGLLVDEADRAVFGRMMVKLAVLHMVRAADAVSVGIANADLPPGSRIDVTSRARGNITLTLASKAAEEVMQRLADQMPALSETAFMAAAAWTRRTVH